MGLYIYISATVTKRFLEKRDTHLRLQKWVIIMSIPEIYRHRIREKTRILKHEVGGAVSEWDPNLLLKRKED